MQDDPMVQEVGRALREVVPAPSSGWCPRAVEAMSAAAAARMVRTARRQRWSLRCMLAAAASGVIVLALLWAAPSRPASGPAKGGALRRAPRPTGGASALLTKVERHASDAGVPRGVAARAHPGREQAGTPRPVAALLTVIAIEPPATTGTGTPLVAGRRLAAGSTVRTGTGGRVTLVTRQGSELALNEQSEVVLLSGREARLVHGELYCRSRGGEIAGIATPAGAVQLLGTIVDAATTKARGVAVTVLKGSVRLSNDRGTAVVHEGERGFLIAERTPEPGAAVDTSAVTAWYAGLRAVISDFGDLAFAIPRQPGLLSELWTMKTNGSGRHRVASLLGEAIIDGDWLPGQQMVLGYSYGLGNEGWQGEGEHDLTPGLEGGIVPGRGYVFGLAAGQALRFELGPGYRVQSACFSPDGKRLAFTGSYYDASHGAADAGVWTYSPTGVRRGPIDPDKEEAGIWVRDLDSGDTRRVLSGAIKTPISWSPDGRFLAASIGEWYGLHHSLVIVDAGSGEVTPLGIEGAGAAFSSDGGRLAYVGDFRQFGRWSQGVPMSGSLFVAEARAGARPRRLSPEAQGALAPSWSPDGRFILYHTEDPSSGYHLLIAAADGSGTYHVYDGPALLRSAWSADGTAIYGTTSEGVLVIAADGSGVRAEIGVGGEELTSAEAQSESAAVEDVRRAISLFAQGRLLTYEGRVRESATSFAEAADIFAGLPWKYPLLQFTADDTLQYADEADRLAARTPQEVLSASCAERLAVIRYLLEQYAVDRGQFPPNLAAVADWAPSGAWDGFGWIQHTPADLPWVRLAFSCPAGGTYDYHAPPGGGDPPYPSTLLACSAHPEQASIWTGGDNHELLVERQWHAERLASPSITRLSDLAEDARHRASVGLTTWDEVEKAYLAVLEVNPKSEVARWYLGRIYARRGETEKAAQMGAGPEYGLTDLPLPAEPGEARLMPDATWHASARDTVRLGKPGFAIDGDRRTKWYTGGGQAAGQWFLLEFDRPLILTRLVLDHYGEESIYVADLPRGIAASFTADGSTWQPVAVTQAELRAPSTVRFAAPTSVKAIRFTLTADNQPESWGIFEILAFGPGG